MDEWKTMLEIAKELNVEKHIVKYQGKKLDEKNFKIINGVTYISPEGYLKIKAILDSKNYDYDFEELVIEELKSIKDLLLSDVNSAGKNDKQVIKNFLDYLKNEEGILEILSELDQESRGTKENKVYTVLIDYLEDNLNLMDDFFG